DLDTLAVLNEEAGTLGDRVLDRVVAVVGGDHQTTRRLRVIDLQLACDLADRSLTLGGAGLEELLDTGQTLGDVLGGRSTTGVEGTHRQLGARLTDRLGRDDADGLADVDELT